MNFDLILNLILTCGVLLFGGFCVYVRQNVNLKAAAEKAIIAAENAYKDTTKAGGYKFKYAVNMVHSSLPAPLRLIISKDIVETVIQNTFNYMENYAKTQLDKLVDKTINNIN